MATRIHVQLDVSGALRHPSKWCDLFRFDGKRPTTEQLRSYLLDEMRAGKIAIPIGCPSPRADGTCPGHDIPSEDPNA